MNYLSERLTRLLVVGVGSIGERHVRCFLKTGRAYVSICEPNSELCYHVSSRYGIEKQFTYIEQALAESFDAALIATPAHLHIKIAQQAVDAGLNLLIEKPLAVNLDGVDELIASIERTNLVCGVAYVLRSHPSLVAMKDTIDSGEYGNPVQLYVTAGQHFPTFRPAFSQTYFRNHATGGGAIQDAMTHLSNATEWIVGPITQVIADAAHQVLPDVDVEDVIHFLARHGAVLGSYSLNQFQAPDEVTITVVCEKGTLRYEGHKDRMRCMKSPGKSWDDHPSEDLDRDALFIKQAHSFLDAVEGHARPLCSLNEGLRSLRVNLALLESIKSKSWQSIE